MPDPSHFHANLQRGALLLNQNRPNEALPFLQAAIAANPDAPQGYAELARCWSELPAQRWKAIDAIDRAIALAPGVSFYHGHKGWCLICLMRYRQALKAAQDGLAHNPHCPQSLNALANAFTKLSQWKKAEEVCRRILAADPNDTPGLNLLAQALRHQGRYKETREVVAQLLANVPNDAFGQANAGYAALAAGDHLRANEHFLNSLRIDPHSEMARRGLLQSLRARIWITRWNMRVSAIVRRPATVESKILFALAVIVVIVIPSGVTAGLNRIHPNAGMYFCAVIAVVFFIFFIGLVLWLVTSLIVGIFGNLMLLTDPLGRHALTRQETIRAIMPAIWTALCAGLFIFNGGVIVAMLLAAVLLLVAATVQIPLLYDRWQRRRLEKSGA